MFGNSNIKLGDFGCCIKCAENSTDDTPYYLVGLTSKYSMKEIISHFNENEPVPKKMLFANDNYSLHITFKQIQDQLKDKISPTSLFNEMVTDLGNFSMTLKEKIDKWTKKLWMNQPFIETLAS